ncbi:MAG: class III extradiol dioxygenase subunit B-like domain-containing protein [Acidobacteriota bacterium]
MATAGRAPEGLIFSALMPHPPIVVPAVGGTRVDACRATLEACRTVSRRLLEHRPERLLLVSPHAPRLRREFGVFAGARYRGDLGRFGADDAAVNLPVDRELAAALGTPTSETADDAVAVRALDDPRFCAADHGAVVPLVFLAEAGWDGPTSVVSLPATPTDTQCVGFGRHVARTLERLDGRCALVASGDMSHRVLPGAPAGFDPRAVEFDHQLTDRIARGALNQISSIDPELRALAAEDAADTCLIAAAAASFEARGSAVLSYEHPFGVGYLVAVLFDRGVRLDRESMDRGPIDRRLGEC